MGVGQSCLVQVLVEVKAMGVVPPRLVRVLVEVKAMGRMRRVVFA